VIPLNDNLFGYVSLARQKVIQTTGRGTLVFAAPAGRKVPTVEEDIGLGKEEVIAMDP
jgi:hypothetical protein